MNLSKANIRRLSVVVTAAALGVLGLLLYGPLSGQDARVLITK